jgi:hypothetical protein
LDGLEFVARDGSALLFAVSEKPVTPTADGDHGPGIDVLDDAR